MACCQADTIMAAVVTDADLDAPTVIAAEGADLLAGFPLSWIHALISEHLDNIARRKLALLGKAASHMVSQHTHNIALNLDVSMFFDCEVFLWQQPHFLRPSWFNAITQTGIQPACVKLMIHGEREPEWLVIPPAVCAMITHLDIKVEVCPRVDELVRMGINHMISLQSITCPTGLDSSHSRAVSMNTDSDNTQQGVDSFSAQQPQATQIEQLSEEPELIKSIAGCSSSSSGMCYKVSVGLKPPPCSLRHLCVHSTQGMGLWAEWCGSQITHLTCMYFSSRHQATSDAVQHLPAFTNLTHFVTSRALDNDMFHALDRVPLLRYVKAKCISLSEQNAEKLAAKERDLVTLLLAAQAQFNSAPR